MKYAVISKYRVPHKKVPSLNSNSFRLAYSRKANNTFCESIETQVLKEHYFNPILVGGQICPPSRFCLITLLGRYL